MRITDKYMYLFVLSTLFTFIKCALHNISCVRHIIHFLIGFESNMRFVRPYTNYKVLPEPVMPKATVWLKGLHGKMHISEASRQIFCSTL